MPGLSSKWIIAAALLAPVPAVAQQFENLDRLDSIVAMSVGANIGQPGGPSAPVDRRLKLAACPQVPQVSGPVFGAAMVECKAIGWRIRVPLLPGGGVQGAPAMTVAGNGYGRPFAALAQAPQMVVKKGDPVQLIAGGPSFSVSRAMIADEDGAVGQTIRVRQDRKSDPVLAQVVETGIVRIPGFKEF